MKRTLPRKWQGVLLAPLLVYLLLPLFGTVWHDVVPEHDHLFLNQPDAPDTITNVATGDDSAAPCTVCDLVTPGRTVVHAYNPASAVQMFGIALGLGASLVLIVPPGPSTRVTLPALFLQAARLAPLDPPPTAAHRSA